MKTLLILGGSQQIGRRLIERIFDEEINEYSISTFNRGLTNPDFFKNKRVKKIIGDRNTDDIKKVFNQDWDLVLDCSCYEPIPFKKLLEGLKGRVGRYVFISTISVYDYKKNIGKEELISENFGLLSFTEEQIRAEGYRNYGEKKVASEKYLLESGLDAIVLRPHFIYGKYDWQNLDYYWIDRIQRFKDLLIPGGKDLIQRTYIEDLVSILLDSFLMEKHQRVYNVVTHDPITINEYLAQLTMVLERDIRFVSVEVATLLASKIRPILDIPLWSNGSHFIFSRDRLKEDFRVDFQSHYQSLVETCAWNEEIKNLKEGKSKWEEGKLGLSREKETNILRNVM